MSEHDSELTAEVKKLRADLESLRAAFDAHTRDHVPSQKEALMKARQNAGG